MTQLESLPSSPPPAEASPHLNGTALLWRDYKSTNDITARNQLIETYLPLADRYAKITAAKMPSEVDKESLVSAATLGLIDAIQAFDPEKGVRFETFCVPRIRGSMIDEMRRMDWVARTSRAVERRMQDAETKLMQVFGRKTNLFELQEHLEMSDQIFTHKSANAHAPGVGSLDEIMFGKIGSKATSLSDTISDKRAEEVERKTLHLDLLRNLFRGLNKKERLLMILYYYEGLPMGEIGKHLGLSQPRISQIHAEIIEMIQEKDLYHRTVSEGES